MGIKIIKISNTEGAWNDIEMSINDFNKLVSVLELSKYRNAITYKNNEHAKTIIIKENI